MTKVDRAARDRPRIRATTIAAIGSNLNETFRAMLLRGSTQGEVRRAGLLWVFTATLLGIAVVVDVRVFADWSPALPGSPIPWWALAVVFGASELFVVEFDLGSNSHSFTLSELPLVVGLFLLTPHDLILAQLVGASVTMLTTGVRSPLRLAFNVANVMVGTAAAILVFRTLIQLGSPLGPVGWIGGFSAAFISDTTATLLVLSAIALSRGLRPSVPHLVSLGTLYTLADTSLAIVSVIVIYWQPEAAWLLVVLAAVFFFGYRAYGVLGQRHASLELLQRATRTIQQALQVERVAEEILVNARQMFSADVVEVRLLPAAGEPGRVARRDDEDRTVWSVAGPAPDEPEWQRISDGLVVRVGPESMSRVLTADPQLEGMSALVAALQGEHALVGAIVVASRSPVVWRADQVALLETLANHANVAIHNSQLVERLRRQAQSHEHDATHDNLTGLPNRVLFQHQLALAVDRAGDSRFAVITLDLDRFKEVNDTLGHHNGDELLRQIAVRLRQVLEDRAFIARLSGDEFALLIERIATVDDAIACAQRLTAAFRPAFRIQELQLDAEASVGIAIYPDHGLDADLLLQRADVAMYAAKSSHAGIEVYDPNSDQNTPARLALMGELREAIEHDQLRVLYQPQLDAITRSTRSVEALVRWAHPRHGLIAAGRFVPLAEQTTLIRPLTLYVMGQAIAAARDWRDRGTPVQVSLNLSVRNLLDATLPDEMEAMLSQHGLAPSSITVEITETALMSDPARAEAVLGRLHDLGVGIAIDDFGTGYASLSYLKRFPVSELKIDRAFVQGIADDAQDLQIVRSTIALAHSLGLRVVAEGSESPDVTAKLISLGCDAIQGYDISVPIAADAVTRRLADEARRRHLEVATREVGRAASAVGRIGHSRRVLTRVDQVGSRHRD